MRSPVLWHRTLVPYVPLRTESSANVLLWYTAYIFLVVPNADTRSRGYEVAGTLAPYFGALCTAANESSANVLLWYTALGTTRNILNLQSPEAGDMKGAENDKNTDC